MGPKKTTEGFVGFQQFFYMYAKLMMGLRDSKVSVSERTPLASQRVVINVGNPSLEELDCAIWVIWDDIMLSRSMSIFITIL